MKRFFLRCVILLANFSASSAVWASDMLRVFAWPGYADADWVSEFEKRYDAHIEVTFVDTDEDLWDKVKKNNGENFDVLAANTAELKRYYEQKWLAIINRKNIPNSKNQLKRFKNKINDISSGENSYAIPFVYSEMGLIYDKKQIDNPPVSMAEMWNKKYKGKVVLYDGSNHNFSLTALVLGFKDPFNLMR